MRIVGAAVVVASVAWCLVGLAYELFDGASEFITASGIVAGSAGTMIGCFILAFGWGAAIERRWRGDLRRGVATIHDPRAGEVSSSGGTQRLICQLEVRAAGMMTSRADYHADVGPLDAPILVAGATFACHANPAVPDQIRVWLACAPHATDLTGRYLDFLRARRTEATPVSP